MTMAVTMDSLGVDVARVKAMAVVFVHSAAVGMVVAIVLMAAVVMASVVMVAAGVVDGADVSVPALMPGMVATIRVADVATVGGVAQARPHF
jgi:hypothetical protein